MDGGETMAHSCPVKERDGTAFCTKCKAALPRESAFYFRRNGHIIQPCKECGRERAWRWALRNPNPTCRRCSTPLTDDNWYNSRKEKHNQICNRCQIALNEPGRKRYLLKNRSAIRDNRVKRNRRRRARVISVLGGICQLCGASTDLHFAHLSYPRTRLKSDSSRQGIDEAIKNPTNFLLLCRHCHFHPEIYLKELIDRRIAHGPLLSYL
jgi:hypothetical protein